MDALWLCLAFFFGAYTLNLVYITVFYHRGLAHAAVILSPRMRRFVAQTGCWVTGIDAKAWVCMHRLHHRYSDTEKDPHSPQHGGIFSVFRKQLHSYEKALVGLIRHNQTYEHVVGDLKFGVSFLYQHKLWYLPYILHLALAAALAVAFSSPWIGLAFFLGISSHPLQGWAVNALAHSKGYRNFATTDHSTNNILVALLVAGEGYQNNHHQFPDSAKFSKRWFEFDWGYQLCIVLSLMGLLRIEAPRQAAQLG